MTLDGRVADAAAAREAFLTLAEAEGSRIPTYARICRIVAEHAELHELLLVPPTGQRLPVLVLAALHDVVLRHPGSPLAPWYPSVTGTDPSQEDPTEPLLDTVRSHRDQIEELLRTRQVQTNEVNRSCAWWWGATHLCQHDDRPLFLIEIGASAGLNLRFDRYHHRFSGVGAGRTYEAGPPDSPVRLGTTVSGGADALGALVERTLPAVTGRVGIDRNPLDPSDPDDRRWLAACVWPEQQLRYERMSAAVDAASTDPPPVLRGDLVEDVAEVIEGAPAGSHVLVLSSWVLVYLERARRPAFAEALADAAGPVGASGGTLSLLTLEAAEVLPWMQRPPLESGASADRRHASILAATRFGDDEPVGTPLGRCQAHLAWCEPIPLRDQSV